MTSRIHHGFVWLKALIAQVGALLVALGIAAMSARFGSLASILAVQGCLAAGLTLLLGLPYWWVPIQALFLPTLVLVLALQLPPTVFLGGFLLLWLVFRSNASERVPLYLSSQKTCWALTALLGERPHPRFLDLGCGLGGTLRYLAIHRPDGEFHGVESAPVPWLISRLRLLGHSNARARLGSLWKEDLSRYDVVYAFLSPAPMPDLWKKACREMRPGSILVSNTFTIPGIEPSRTVPVDDSRHTRLLIWNMGAMRNLRVDKAADTFGSGPVSG